MAAKAAMSLLRDQTFSIWAKSSSTGVARPKIVTETRSFDLS
jgi:hypothetical protein